MAKNQVHELDEQYKSAIDNYGNQIKTFKDWCTSVKKRPSYHCGGLNERGFISLQREVFQNSVDQVVMENSPANMISFYYNEQTLETSVEDNGLGFPFNDIERIVTTPNTSKNYEKKPGNFSTGYNGVGLKITSCLSSKLIAESYRYDGTAIQFTTVEGYPLQGKNISNPKSIPNKNYKQGSKVTFWPNTEVLGEINLPWQEIYNLIYKIISRTPIGTICKFEAVDKEGKTHKEEIINKDGIFTDIIQLSKAPICKPIEIFNNNGYHRLHAGIIFDGSENPSGLIRSVAFCNMCPTIAGTHIDGTVDGVCKWFTKYMNDIFLSNNKNKVKIIPADIKGNIIISIAADALEPVFIGQAKEQLANKEMAPFCRDTVINGLNDWSKANPSELTKICKYLKEVAEIRAKNEKVKETIVNKFQANAITGYPAKFARSIKEKKEFIIVEGDR